MANPQHLLLRRKPRHIGRSLHGTWGGMPGAACCSTMNLNEPKRKDLGHRHLPFSDPLVKLVSGHSFLGLFIDTV